MEADSKSIHDFDVSLICEYFSNMERQGPGSPEVTVKALGFVNNLTRDSHIADIGCGTGGQTIILADNTDGHITGVDLFPAFIDIFNSNVNRRGLRGRVKGIVGSMFELPFDNEELDLIWSEGAIYNIGFEKGLKEWRRFLKPGGFIAVSEVSWFTKKRPEEIEDFWQDAYPQIDTIPKKIKLLQETGYIPVASFILPEECWIENFYEPQTEARRKFLEKYRGNKTVEDFIENEKNEARLYDKYKEYYGYVFYIGKKCDI